MSEESREIGVQASTFVPLDLTEARQRPHQVACHQFDDEPSNLSQNPSSMSERSRLVTSVEEDLEFRHEQASTKSSGCTEESSEIQDEEEETCKRSNITQSTSSKQELHSDARDQSNQPAIELRLLVRRREAGALIGKRGSNIKRLRESFRSSMFSIPDTGNGPERVVCIVTNESSLDAILEDLTRLLTEKSLENDDQIELKLLIHSSHAGSIIGLGGQSIKKLRNESKAAIKIYEMCCPLSNERVCAIKAKPPVVVSTIKLIQLILNENPIKGTIKPYDALHFDLNLVDKYGGYLPDEPLDAMMGAHSAYEMVYSRQLMEAGCSAKHFNQLWRTSTDFRQNCGVYDQQSHNPSEACRLKQQATSSGPQPDQTSQQAAQPSRNANSDEQSGPPTTQQHGPRPGRFHPYASQQHLHYPMDMACANRYLPGQLARHQLSYMRSQYGPVNHFRAQNAIRLTPGAFYNQIPPIERCRHARPCLCMLLPPPPSPSTMLQPQTPIVGTLDYNMHQTGSDFVQLAGKAFGWPARNPTQASAHNGFNKKS